jgi:hypothetical protein
MNMLYGALILVMNNTDKCLYKIALFFLNIWIKSSNRCLGRYD